MSATKVKNRKGVNLDFYETPANVVHGLMDNFTISGKLLEPSAGKGAILKVLNYRDSTAVEIQESFRTFLEPLANTVIGDFLNYENKFDTIISNPPFSQSEQFVRHAYELLNDGGRMAFLLRLSFLGSVKRYSLFQQIKLKEVLLLSQRPKFGGNNIDSCDYAWFIWHKTEIKETILKWIMPRNFTR